jgi:hypothetical protein
MPMRIYDPLQTMARAYEEICAGEEPWVALGNFINEWFMYATDRRAELVAEAPVEGPVPTPEEHRWACFIAASVEYLCQQYAIPYPPWVHEHPDCYRLAEPWYDTLYLDEEIRAWLEETTPEPFRKRNIYCGERLYVDKREVVAYAIPSEFSFKQL